MNRKELIDNKISQAEKILKDFRVQDGRLQALTLLALCCLKPGDDWSVAVRTSLTLSNDIMEFVNVHYDADYKPNTRESFRKNALKIFIDSNIVELNPDNPSLRPNSSKTHYAITPLAVNTINKFGSNDWDIALDNFIRYREQSVEQLPYFKLKKILVKGYKSIVEDEIELGRFNVFIGANGTGKSNVLEILALAGAGRSNNLSFDGLYSRGVRMARPNLILSSFKEGTSKSSIDILLEYEDKVSSKQLSNSFTPTNPSDIYTKWLDLGEEELIPEVLLKYFKEITEKLPGISGNDLLNEANTLLKERGHQERSFFDEILYEYSVFDLNTKSLRGITPAESKQTPLGLNGEGLDLLIATFSKKERNDLEKAKLFFDWLEDIVTENDEKLKLAGLKPGRSISTLYFTDYFMQKQNNIFSAENSNEGVLHVLFYISLFISNKTPRLFAIDNIETALNPRLCQALIVELVELSHKYEKQVLITTHNPAVLDGLNLFDDDQRLFEVYRNDKGYTKTRRIKFKKDLSDKTYKLSEMWMKGLLGAVPENF